MILLRSEKDTNPCPQSPYLHEKLGAVYEMIDEPQKALESYQNALRFNPENKVAAEKIQQLKK